MENKELYDLIEKFLSSIKMSRRKFAKIAGIPPTTFQHRIEKQSNINSDAFLSIDGAMGTIAINTSDKNKREELLDLTDEFERKYFLLDYADPFLKKAIEAMDSADDEALQAAWSGFLNHEFSENYTYKERQYKHTVDDAFELLNETGKKIAAERVEELTMIPGYRKDNE